MSGFEFHISCSACGLTSSTFPFRYDSLVATGALELPAVNRQTSSFERVLIPIEEQLDDVSIQQLAAQNSSPELTILVPYFGDGSNDIVLRPVVACPSCGQNALEARFGSPPESMRPVTTVDQIVNESRGLPEDTTTIFRMTSPDAVVRCTRHMEGGESVYRWRVERVGKSDIASLVKEIVEWLSRRGSRCTPPKCMRAFCRFEERTSA